MISQPSMGVELDDVVRRLSAKSNGRPATIEIVPESSSEDACLAVRQA
jgi:hypothetical protein